MNIYFAVPSLVILLAILIIWFTTEKLDLYSERIFYKYTYFLAAGVILCLAIVILYKIFGESMSKNVLSVVSMGYLICIVCFLYYKDLHFFSSFMSVTQCKKISFPFAGYALFQAVVIIATSEKYNFFETVISLNNTGSLLLILFFVCHILIVVGVGAFYIKRINRYSIRVYAIDCLIIAIGIVLELVLKINGSLNLVLALDCIYSLRYIDNPRSNINKDFKCFKSNVLVPYLQEQYSERNACFIVNVGFGYLTTNPTIEKEIFELKGEIVGEFLSVPNTKVFIGADGSVYAINQETIYKDFIEDTKEMVEEKVRQYNNIISVKIGITSCANILLVENESILMIHLSSCLKTAFLNIKHIAYEEVTQDIINSIAMEEEIKNKIIWALNNDKLEAFYQPIFSAAKQGFSSAEALARIRNDDGTVMLPGSFISIADKNGLIIQIGDRIYEKVCELISAPSSKEYNLDFVSINLSNTQCEDIDLAKRYTEIAKKYDIDPSRIEFEINEKDFVSIKDKVMKNVNDFVKNGFRVALDGYGSSESSFYSLLDFPITSIKLDMHLVWNYSESEIQRKAIQSIIKMAHALKIEVVAEGIETINQLEEMVLQNVDHIQGYYFFMPMDLEGFKQFLRPTAFEVSGEGNVTTMDKINSIRQIGHKK